VVTNPREDVVTHFIRAVADYIFGCHHKALSRVFTIGRKTYQVCCDCGAEFEYSLKTMSHRRTPAPGPLCRTAAAPRPNAYGSYTRTASVV